MDISKDENWEEIIDACPAVALTMDSREMTVEEAIEEASKDEPFSNTEVELRCQAESHCSSMNLQ